MGETEKLLTSIEDRLKKIEKVVFGKKLVTKFVSEDFSDLAGGIRLLIKNDYFKTPRTSSEVFKELGREGYHHKSDAVYTALSRDFVKNWRSLFY